MFCPAAYLKVCLHLIRHGRNGRKSLGMGSSILALQDLQQVRHDRVGVRSKLFLGHLLTQHLYERTPESLKPLLPFAVLLRQGLNGEGIIQPLHDHWQQLEQHGLNVGCRVLHKDTEGLNGCHAQVVVVCILAIGSLE
jgi:hypothetical protein